MTAPLFEETLEGLRIDDKTLLALAARDTFNAVCEIFDLPIQAAVPSMGIRFGYIMYRWTHQDLYVLPFYMQLAEAFGVPLNHLELLHEEGGDGCETCGYGSECSFCLTIKVPEA